MAVSNEVRSVALTVGNLDKSLHFYRDLLGFRVVDEQSISGPQLGAAMGLTEAPHPAMKTAFLHAPGSQTGSIALIEWSSPPGVPKDNPPTGLIRKGLFVLLFEPPDIEALQQKLQDAGVDFISTLTPMVWDKGGRMRAFLVRDPDGVVLEFVEYL